MRIDPGFRLSAVLLAALAGACAAPPAAQTAAAVPPPAAAAPAEGSSPAARGFAFAASHCSGCHAVGRDQLSADPAAPPFEAVVNKPGLTRETLNYWLRTSHNYPEIMNFDIDPDRVDDLAAYMLTLRTQS